MLYYIFMIIFINFEYFIKQVTSLFVLNIKIAWLDIMQVVVYGQNKLHLLNVIFHYKGMMNANPKNCSHF